MASGFQGRAFQARAFQVGRLVIVWRAIESGWQVLKLGGRWLLGEGTADWRMRPAHRPDSSAKPGRWKKSTAAQGWQEGPP